MLENQSSKNASNEEYKEDLGFLSKKPMLTIIVMFIILILGLVFLLLKRNMAQDDKSINSHPTIDNLITVKDSIKLDYGINDLFEILDLEKQLNEVMSKDTLTSVDSLFIKTLDRKLNKLLDETN